MSTRIEIGIDCTEPDRLAPFWAAALGYSIGDLDRDGVYLDLVPAQASQPVVYFQKVPEPKVTKNRLHLDLMTPDTEEMIARLTRLGASVIGSPCTGSEGGWWQVMADPDGNEFCVCRVSAP